jgi:hypothetical protein
MELAKDDVPFPYKVEMVEFSTGQWGVKAVITDMTVEQSHQFGETLADFLDEFNKLNT